MSGVYFDNDVCRLTCRVQLPRQAASINKVLPFIQSTTFHTKDYFFQLDNDVFHGQNTSLPHLPWCKRAMQPYCDIVN